MTRPIAFKRITVSDVAPAPSIITTFIVPGKRVSNKFSFSGLCWSHTKLCLVSNIIKSTSQIVVFTYRRSIGDLVAFDNTRVLHARSAYSLTAGEERYLEGGYVEWDEMQSRRRVLAKRLGIHEQH